MRFVHRLIALFAIVSATSLSAADLKKPHRASVPVPPAAAEAVTVNAPSKIEAGLLLTLRDSTLRTRIDRYYKAGDTRGIAPRFAIEQASDGTTLLPVFIQTRDVDATKKSIVGAHGSVSTVVKNHIVARLPLAAVEALAANPEIDRIEPSYLERPALDVSRREIKADQVQSGIGLSGPFTGRGVVVGVLDSGIDWSHADFKDAQGRSRIVSLWDETTSGKPPAGTGKGYECTRNDIDASNCPERDTNGHGTHVAGIAAGNGRSRSGNTFTGIAPDADLVIVKAGNNSFSQTNIVDGVSYIFRTATSLGKPAVVNLSLGGHNGAHDGTSAYEQSLTDLLAPGHLITVANGNEGDERIHVGYEAQGTSYATGISTFWKIDHGSTSSTIDMWYSGSISTGVVANVKVAGQLTGVFSTPAIPSGSSLARTQVTAAGSTLGYVTIATEVTSNGSRHLVAQIDNNGDSSIDLSQVTWEFFSYGSGRVDAWVVAGGAFSDFDDPSNGYYAGDFAMTVGLPATASNMIAVGSYTTKTTWVDIDGTNERYNNQNPLGQISTFSSLGPTRDGRRRPIITAPGEAIASALSSAADISSRRPFVLSGGSYQIEQGTSQATPHVTGVVAMMLQAKPDLKVTDAYTILRGKARKDSFTGSTANNTYGDGKADALAYVAEAAGNPIQPTVCTATSTTLCLAGSRFAVSATFLTQNNHSGQAQVVPLTPDTGYLWWESSSNVEVVVKVLNACIFTPNIWVFAGGLTNQQVTLTVVDTKSGAVKSYTNKLGDKFQPVQDVTAFSSCP